MYMNNYYGYDPNTLKSHMGMTRKELEMGDILEFKNKNRVVLDEPHYWIILRCYDDALNHLTNDQYTINKVYRPQYNLVYDRGKVKIK